MIAILETIDSVKLECCPVYASNSSGKAELLVQALSVRAHVIMTNTDISESLWAEAMPHGSRYQNRMPLTSVNNLAPIGIGKSQPHIAQFPSLSIFRKPRFAYIYHPLTSTNRNLITGSTSVYFVLMKSDKRLCQAVSPQLERVDIVKLSNFQFKKQSCLFFISTLLDGFSRKRE